MNFMEVGYFMGISFHDGIYQEKCFSIPIHCYVELRKIDHNLRPARLRRLRSSGDRIGRTTGGCGAADFKRPDLSPATAANRSAKL